MKSVPKHIPRQQVPEDSFSRDLSEIYESSSLMAERDVFITNDRNPQCQNSHEMEPFIDWINYSLPTDTGSKSGNSKTMMHQMFDQPKVLEMKTKLDRSVFFSLNFGEQKPINLIKRTVIKKDNSMILNKTMSIVSRNQRVQLNLERQNKSQFLLQSQQPTISNNEQISLYRIQHECNITFKRLLTISVTDQMLPQEMAALRRYLIQSQGIISKNKHLQYKFKGLISDIQSVLKIISQVEVLIYQLNVLEDTVKSIVHGITDVDNLKKLVKVVSIKKVLKKINKILVQFQDLLKEKRTYINGSAMVGFLQNKIKVNIAQIKEILEVFSEQQLRRVLRSTKQEVLQLLRDWRNTTQIQKEALLQIGCQSH